MSHRLYCASCGAHYQEIQGGHYVSERYAIRSGWLVSERWPARAYCVRLVCQAEGKKIVGGVFGRPEEQLRLL